MWYWDALKLSKCFLLKSIFKMKQQHMNFKISWACALKSEKMNVQDEETWFDATTLCTTKSPANIWMDSWRSYGGFVRSNFSDFTLSEKPSTFSPCQVVSTAM